MSKTAGYVIVRHSAFYTEHLEFRRATDYVGTEKQAVLDKVDKAGGIWFPTYEQAEAFVEKANYPAGTEDSIIPDCRGRFGSMTVEGLHIYLPVREVVG